MTHTSAFYSERLALLKAQCYHQLRQAVKSGEVERPARCQRCGEELPLQGHHRDYSEALDVDWVCRRCHRALHRRLRLLACGARRKDKGRNCDAK